MALEYGFVVGQFVEVVGDRGPTQDADRMPDEIGTTGTVTFRPTPATITDTENGLMKLAVPRPVQLTLDSTGKFIDANGLPGVWLIAGIEYTVSCSFISNTWKIYPTAEHTLDAPLDSIAQIPITPAPNVRFVLSEQTLIDALAAVERAEAAADAAEQASGGARVTSVNDRNGAVLLTKADVGLDLVSNLAPASMPISLQTQAALDTKAVAGRLISPGTGLAGGGSLAADRTISLSPASIASLLKADSASQPGHTHTAAQVTDASSTWAAVGRAIAAGTGLTGGGTLVADRTLSLSPASIASLAKADTAVQPAALSAKADLVGGVIPTSQMPPIALGTRSIVASQAAMLALTTAQVQPGDFAVRTDGAGTFLLVDTDPSVLGNWQLLESKADAVLSINSQTGAVVLAAADVGAVALAQAGNAQVYAKGSTGSAIGVGYGTAVTGNALVQRDSSGQVATPTPAAATDATNKTYVDTADALRVPISAAGNQQVFFKNPAGAVGGLDVTTAASNGALAQRTASGDLIVPGTPAASTNATSRQYVDDRAGDKSPTDNATAASAITIDGTQSKTARRQLTGNVTATISGTPTAGLAFSVTLILVQDATGGRTVTWPAAIKWPGGVKPVLSTAANAIDVVTIFWDGTEWVGFLSGVAFA